MLYGSLAGGHWNYFMSVIRAVRGTAGQNPASLLQEAVIWGEPEFVREIITTFGGKLNRRDITNAFGLAIRSGNMPMFRLFVDQILPAEEIGNYKDYIGYVYLTDTDASRVIKIPRSDSIVIPYSLYGFPLVTNPEIIEELLASSGGAGELPEILYSLTHQQATPERIDLYRRILQEDPAVQYDDLLIYIVETQSAAYAKLVLPLASEEGIGAAIRKIRDVETLRVFLDAGLLTDDDLQEIFYRNAATNPPLITYFLSTGVDDEDFNDAFAKAITREEYDPDDRTYTPDVREDVLEAYLPYLNDSQRAFGARIAKKTGNEILGKYFL